MSIQTEKIRLAIVGGGPSALFIYKRLVETGRENIEIDIFEKNAHLGEGMPYSDQGANLEHLTNVSGNEIPTLVTSLQEWIQSLDEGTLKKFNLNHQKFTDYKVVPRLLFGRYLSAQFDLLMIKAQQMNIVTRLHLGTRVVDMIDQSEQKEIIIKTDKGSPFQFSQVIICTGHEWPKEQEGRVPGYYDSPYPPAKLTLKLNHPVAIQGSSLTAIDALRTLAHHNGIFKEKEDGSLSFHLGEDSSEFKMMMFSRHGLLPAVRFHLDNPRLTNDSLLTSEQIARNRWDNEGFLSLDFVFENDFKALLQKKDPELYNRVRDVNLEGFVETVMEMRESLDPFELLKAEYKEAEKSIKKKESVYWKEFLAVLSFAMNYPAKHFSAEDMLRLQKKLMPLISVVIAFVPQNSCRELLALHAAGVLDLTPVGSDSRVETRLQGGVIYHYTDSANQRQAVPYKTFINCVGQPHLSYFQFPFKSLISKQLISPARLKFRSSEQGQRTQEEGNSKVDIDAQGNYFLNVPGITINDRFQIVDPSGCANLRIFIMAIPFIGGYNPDYSGLDFCESTSAIIVKSIFEHKV